jgi:hypothetical protein
MLSLRNKYFMGVPTPEESEFGVMTKFVLWPYRSQIATKLSGDCISTMATRKHYDLSKEQLALAKARKEKKMNQVSVTKGNGSLQLLSRRWLSFPHLEHPEKSRYHQVKIMTWNVCRLLLATCTCILLNPCRKQAPCAVLDKYEIKSRVISRRLTL